MTVESAITIGAPGLVFDQPQHLYTLDGRIVPSVTGILRAMGLIDFSGIPDYVLEEARLRGTTTHTAVQYFNERDLDVAQFMRDYPDWAGYLQAWITFVDTRHFQPVLNEHRVASRRHQVAGTLDCLGWLDGKAVLLDYATGRPADVSKDLQTAAYHALATEWAAEGDQQLAEFLEAASGVIARYAVALHRDGTYTLEPYTSHRDYRDFLSLVDAYHVRAARLLLRQRSELAA